MLLYLPLAHNFGRLMHLLGADVGFTVALLPRPARIGDAMPQVRPTILPDACRASGEGAHRGRRAASSPPRASSAVWSTGRSRSAGARATFASGGEPLPRGARAQHRLADRLVYSKVKERLGGRLRAAHLGRRAARAGDRRVLPRARHPHPRGLRPDRVHDAPRRSTGPTHFRFGTVGPADPGHRAQDRRRRRDPDRAADRVRGLLQRRRRRRARRSTTTAGSAPATSASSTRTASSPSPTARRT